MTVSSSRGMPGGRKVALGLAEGQRGGRRLVDDVDDFQPGHLTGVGGRLAAQFVEIGRHGDHRLRVEAPRRR